MNRPLPHDVEAERAIVGAILLDERALDEIFALVRPDDCYHPQNTKILANAFALRAAGEPVDAVTLMGGLDEAGAVWLADTPSICTATNVAHYACRVRDLATIRELIRVCIDVARDAGTAEHGADELIGSALAKIQGCYRSTANTLNLAQLTAQYVADCEYRFKHPDEVKPLGVPTGFRHLDEMLVFSGLARGHVTTVAAQTSKGKSALAQAFMRHAAQAGCVVLDVTLEDRAQAVTGRQLSAESGIQNLQLQRQEVRANEWSKLATAASSVTRWGSRVDFIDVRAQSVDELLARCRRDVSKRSTDLIILDYLQLIPSGQPFRKRQDHVDYTFERIEEFAGQNTGTAVVLVSQMARHDGRPTLDKLYHSAKLEQGSHTVLLIWDPETRQHHNCRAVDLAKQKDGPTGLRVLGWEGRCVRFFDADPVDIEKYLHEVKQ